MRRVAEHPLEVHHPEEPAGGRLVRRKRDADGGPQRGRQLVAADEGQALGDGGVGGEDDRLGRHQTAGGVGRVAEEHAHVVGLLRLHQLEQVLTALVGELGDQVGRVVRLHLIEHVGGAVVVELARGSAPARSRASLRGRRRAGRRAALRPPRASAAGGGRGACSRGRPASARSRWRSAARPTALTPRFCFSRTSFQAANVVGPLPNGEDPVFGRRTKSWLMAHSPVADCSIATSSIVASPLPSVKTTRRPSISAMTRTSPPRCSKRRTLMRPVVMIWPLPMLVTRPIDTKTRRLPGISTIRPTTRGGSLLR